MANKPNLLPLQVHDEPEPIRQTDFSPGSGNALQACVAALFHLQMEQTPNFVTLPNYEEGIREFVSPFFYNVRKRKPPATTSSTNTNCRALCILRGKSPRGDFGHVVVARCKEDGGFEFVWDPHPDSTFLDDSETYGWYMTFEKTS